VAMKRLKSSLDIQLPLKTITLTSIQLKTVLVANPNQVTS
jgi:hypothetical protein